ncbi:MAG TPA: substrate-binding domain-containing protein [Streptosporangiaceae bacterium]|nr:substrate-binding domain-containing protein [Streptosporangiaceae bacterium]
MHAPGSRWRSQRPTLESIAHEAGVSRQTVSNVLNAPHLVSKETRRRVEAVIARTGYRPVKAGQTLRTRRSYLIAVGLQTPAEDRGEVEHGFLHALTERAQIRGYRTLVYTAGNDDAEIGTYESLLSEYDLDGLVLTGTHIGDKRTAWLADQDVPFVTFGRPWGTAVGHAAAGHSWVDVDGASGVLAASRHLIGRGYRRIAFLGWPEGSGVGDDRRSGWETACREAALPADGLAVRVENSLAAGRAACAGLLASKTPPDAFVCVSDLIALGAWSLLTTRALVSGSRPAVVGFDDSAAAAAAGLSSVAQPLAEVANACLDCLQKLQKGPRAREDAPDMVLLEPRLIVRSSTGGASLAGAAVLPGAAGISEIKVKGFSR